MGTIKKYDLLCVILVITLFVFVSCSEDGSRFDYKALYRSFGSYNADKKNLLIQFQENFLKDTQSHDDISKFVYEQLISATDCLARHQSNLVKIFLSEQDHTSTIITKKEAFQQLLRDLSCYDVLEFILQNAPSEKNYLASTDERGWTPLHMAVEFGFTEVVELFLKSGMDPSKPILPSVTVQTEDGRTIPYFAEMTPLHLAVIVGEGDILQLLIQHKAFVHAKDSFGRTPLDIAQVLYNTDHPIVQLLKQQPGSEEHSAVEETQPSSHLEVDSTKPIEDRNTEYNGGWKTKLDASLMNDFGQIPCQVRTIETGELNVEMFLRDHVSIKRPLRILQGASSWKAMEAWTKDKFKQSYGTLKVDAGAIPYGEIFGMDHKMIKIGDFVRYMDSTEQEAQQSTTAPRYIFDSEVLASSSRSLMKRDYEFHPVFRQVWKSFHQFPQFFLGGPKTGAPFHYHCHAVNGIAWGTKRWFLLPPSESFYSREPVWEWVSRQDKKELDKYGFQCIQEASDVLYVPSFWTHAVLNLKTSIGSAVETDAIYC